jgi:hypothetical protein
MAVSLRRATAIASSVLLLTLVGATGRVPIHNASVRTVDVRADSVGYIAAASTTPAVSIALNPSSVVGTRPSGWYGLSIGYDALVRATIAVTPVLVTLMRNLGPGGLLRIGGNSVDSQATSGPNATQLAALKNLLTQTGWRVLYSISLIHFDAASEANEVRNVRAALGNRVAAFACGNEPDGYVQKGWRPTTYTVSQYLAEVAPCYQLIRANAPGVPLDGPDTCCSNFVQDYLASKPAGLGELTQHFYGSYNACNGKPFTAYDLLSAYRAAKEVSIIGQASALARSGGVPLRISEGNSAACTGVRGVSNTYAASLWSSDLGFIAAENGAKGFAVHGTFVQSTCVDYSPICRVGSGPYVARPPYYGMLFDQLIGAGSIIATATTGSANLGVHAIRHADGSISVLLVNRAGTSVQVKINGPSTLTSATMLTMRSPGGIAATSGIQIQGHSVNADGSFAAPVPTRVTDTAGTVQTTIAGYTATAITLAPAE